MLIQTVIKDEAERNANMIRQYEALIEELPRGALICRKKEYYYLKYRQAGKLYDEYIGKDPMIVAEVRNKIEQRRHYMKMLMALKEERKIIQKVLGDLI